MKSAPILLSFLLLSTGVIKAQNLDLYGIQGNPLALAQNPGASTDLKFHLSLPGLTTQGNMTTPLGDLWGDLGEQLRVLEAPNLGWASATDVEIVGFGWKRKKGYTWIQSGVDIDAKFHLDKDLFLFGLYGMKDASGQIDPNYVGDFSSSDLGLSAMGRVAIGHQRALNDKLRVGASLQVNRLLGGFQWDVNDWSLTSTLNPNTQTNTLTWNSDMRISALGLIAEGAQLDSAMDFPRYLLMGMVPAYLDLLKGQKNTYSLNVGLTYQATKRWSMSASVTGLSLSSGATSGGIANSRSLAWSSNFTYDGFTAGFSPQDTGTWSYYLTNLQSQVIDGFQIESALPVRYSAPFTVQGAMYYKLLPNHRVGVHGSHIDRLSGVHQALGLEYQGFFGPKLQLTGAYRWHRWDGLDGASELSTMVQHRILPWTTFYLGTNLWLSTPAYVNSTLLLPANFQSWQVTTGLNVTFFENRFKEERKARKAARKSNREAKKSAKKGTN